MSHVQSDNAVALASGVSREYLLYHRVCPQLITAEGSLVVATAPDDIDDVVRLLVLTSLISIHRFYAVLKDSCLSLRVNFPKQERIVDHLRAHVFKWLLWVGCDYVIPPDHETVFGWK